MRTVKGARSIYSRKTLDRTDWIRFWNRKCIQAASMNFKTVLETHVLDFYDFTFCYQWWLIHRGQVGQNLTIYIFIRHVNLLSRDTF